MLSHFKLPKCDPYSNIVYISGPMSGMQDHNFPLFHKVAADLRENQYQVQNPAENTENKDQSWEFCIRTDLKQLLHCDTVVFLPGWEKSKGAQVEHTVAKALRMRLFRYETDEDNLCLPYYAELTDPPEESILEEAQRLVTGHRNKSYDHPLDNFTRIAALWSVILESDVTPEDVGLCMIMTKAAREMHQHTRDNLTDIAGYALTIDQVIKEREKRST